jgi:hypothetical protein
MKFPSKLWMAFLSNVIFIRLAFYADADPDPSILVQKFMVVIMSCCLKEVYTHSPYRGNLPPKWQANDGEVVLYCTVA